MQNCEVGGRSGIGGERWVLMVRKLLYVVMDDCGCDGEDDDVRAKGLGVLERLSEIHLVNPIKPPVHFSILGHMQIIRINYPCVFT